MEEPTYETCFDCGCPEGTSRMATHRFDYGADAPVTLEAEIRVWSCPECGAQWRGGDSEEPIDMAVQQHLRSTGQHERADAHLRKMERLREIERRRAEQEG